MSLQPIFILAVLCCTCHLASSLSQEALALKSASTRFSQMLYQEVGANQPNAIVSSFSLHACLSMAAMGARGNTAQEMLTTLQVTESSSLHEAYRDIIDNFNSVSLVDLLIGNAMYLNPAFSIKEEYQDDVDSYYHAKAENFNLDASSGPEAPINSWVAQQTRNKITDLIKPGEITDDTAMLLINTIFFNGTWLSTFNERMTTQSNFYKIDGSQTQVDLMQKSEFFALNREAIPGVDVISLPFRDSRFSLFIALPNTAEGLSRLESFITTSGNLDTLFENFEYTYVNLYLPKFKLTATMDLKNALINMGMGTAFRSNADFSGVSSTPTKISKVLQKATIEVTEAGTVATAATAIQAVYFSAPFRGEGFLFKADHTFLYFLRDELSGQILFHGKLQDPDITEFEI